MSQLLTATPPDHSVSQNGPVILKPKLHYFDLSKNTMSWIWCRLRSSVNLSFSLLHDLLFVMQEIHHK